MLVETPRLLAAVDLRSSENTSLLNWRPSRTVRRASRSPTRGSGYDTVPPPARTDGVTTVPTRGWISTSRVANRLAGAKVAPENIEAPWVDERYCSMSELARSHWSVAVGLMPAICPTREKRQGGPRGFALSYLDSRYPTVSQAPLGR